MGDERCRQDPRDEDYEPFQPSRHAHEAPPPKDGRAARALRTRKAVADALLDLIADGDLRPTSKNIAERAGVSERTIFQHFEDLEKLFSAAVHRVGERYVRDRPRIAEQGSFDERLSAYIHELAYLNEVMTPVRRAARLHEPYSPALCKALGWWRGARRRGIGRIFQQELGQWAGDARRDVLESLQLLASWSSWENMTLRSGFGVERAREVLEMSFRALLRQPAAPARERVDPALPEAEDVGPAPDSASPAADDRDERGGFPSRSA